MADGQPHQPGLGDQAALYDDGDRVLAMVAVGFSVNWTGLGLGIRPCLIIADGLVLVAVYATLLWVVAVRTLV